MLKILQVSLQQYVNRELPDVQDEFRKARGSSHQIANVHWTIKKAREFQKLEIQLEPTIQNFSYVFICFKKECRCFNIVIEKSRNKSKCLPIEEIF